jgi:aspartyl protease family protein
MSRSSNIKWIVGLGVAAVLLGGVLVFTYQPQDVLGNNSATMSLIHNLVWLVVLAGSVIVHFRTNFGQAIKYAAAWIAVGSIVFVGYSLRDDVGGFAAKLKSEIIPQQGMASADSISFRTERGGHFVVDASVDGTTIRFLVDTGASTVVLTPKDAERLGLDLKRLSFDRIFQTANGTVRGASVKLGQIKIGPIELNDVRASVNGAAMKTSLLGMSFLSRIGGYEVAGDKLVLKR